MIIIEESLIVTELNVIQSLF